MDSTAYEFISGDVVIDPTSLESIQHGSKIGPFVSIGKDVKIAKGVRIQNSIIQDDVEIKNCAFIKNSIIGKGSIIGMWARVEAERVNEEVKEDAESFYKDNKGCTVLGEGVRIAHEVIVKDCRVFSHK